MFCSKFSTKRLTFNQNLSYLNKLLYKSRTRIKAKRKKMSNFAIFQTGGKQYRVSVGDIIKVEKLNAEAKVEFDQVLMVGDKVGSPVIEGAKIVAEVLEQKRTPKILVFKKKRRQNYRRTHGHRQYITVLKITEIKG